MADELSNPQLSQGGSEPGPVGTTAPPGQSNPDAMERLQLVQGIVRNTRLLAQKVPGAVDIIRQINDLTQKLQVKIMQSGPGPQAQAPPMG